MADKLQVVKNNAELVKQTIQDLKNELKTLNKEYHNILAKELIEENIKLTAAVEEAKRQLIQLEIQNGIQQIAVPNGISDQKIEKEIVQCAENKQSQPESKIIKEPKIKKEKKPKEAKETPAELPIDFGRLDLRIGKVENVERHPDADSLYVLKINCGEDKVRTVCSGLVKHVPIDELRDRIVVVLCNLKPVKMRGITSEAMVMCASSENGVEVLIPPESSLPGDVVNCDGYARQPDSVMNPKKKIFETVAPDLHTDDQLQACYKATPWNVAGKGYVLSKTLKCVPVK